MLPESLLLDQMPLLAKTLAELTFKHLSERHSVDVPYLMDEKVSRQYTQAIRVACTAFLKKLESPHPMTKQMEEAVRDYLQSETVTEEISKLLDPGLEIFDLGALTDAFGEKSLGPVAEIDECTVAEAWEEFLKAFSYASRSSPDLREFLRASYEAGSFRAISNIADALDQLDGEIDLMIRQESKLKSMITDYLHDLSSYGEWARRFSFNH